MKKKFKVTINNKTYEVEVEDIGNDFSTIENTDRLNTSRRIEDTPNIKSLEKKKIER